VSDISQEIHSYKSRCPFCKKFLTRPIVKIQSAGLTDAEYGRFRQSVMIIYGSETKCRFCKKVRQTEQKVEMNDLRIKVVS
jgi:phage FluMu protein Com